MAPSEYKAPACMLLHRSHFYHAFWDLHCVTEQAAEDAVCWTGLDAYRDCITAHCVAKNVDSMEVGMSCAGLPAQAGDNDGSMFTRKMTEQELKEQSEMVAAM